MAQDKNNTVKQQQ